MFEPENASRPRSVTLIGWLWLVVGVLFFLRALVNLVVWRILKPDLLGMLETFGEIPQRQQRLLRPLFEHLAALQFGEAILSAAVIVIAIALLRLRPWARAGAQAICWIALLWTAAFGAFWIWLCRSVAEADASSSQTWFGSNGLLMGLCACAVVAAGLAVMILSLRTPRVRRAFSPAGPPSA